MGAGWVQMWNPYRILDHIISTVPNFIVIFMAAFYYYTALANKFLNGIIEKSITFWDIFIKKNIGWFLGGVE